MITRTTERAARSKRAAPWHFIEGVGSYCGEILESLQWRSSPTARGTRTLGVTSSRRGEGVTTVAAHLAVAAAARQVGKVLFVDANLGRPSARRMFGVLDAPGLFECVCNGEPAAELFQPSDFENLSILTAGHTRGGPAAVYDSPHLPELILQLSEHFHLTIFDLPSAAQISCKGHMTRALDALLLVVEAERVRWESAQRAKELLIRSGGHLVGAVLNKRREIGADFTGDLS